MAKKDNDLIGIFLGMQGSSYEYIANIIAPYQQTRTIIIGDIILIDNINEDIVARIMDVVPRGEFMTFSGEKWLSDVALYEDAIGQDIKKQKISYQVKIKLLGRLDENTNKFTPGLKSVPHITSKVKLPSIDQLKVICNQALKGQEEGIKIGTYWLDENDQIDIHLDIKQLNCRRTFIFARAGYGKSNLMKIIASNWKSENGALFVFDPEGEYAVTDQEGKPGVLDITPAILITMRKNVAESIGHNVYTNLKFNLKDFSADFILPKIIPAQKHEMIFFRKLMGLNQEQWGRLVDLLYADKWKASHDEITAIIKEVKEEDSGEKDESTGPIMNNLVAPIQNLHDPVSKLRHVLEIAAGKGYSVILDISLMDSYTALQFCSIVISYFFNKNQRSFTDESESLAKVVFAVEEAQSVLGTNSNVSSFVELAKEGRKYHLGGIFITQQPGSIMPEILSQGDNFFAFHMISKNDILSLQKANAHYSDDVATQLLNEPVKGKCYMWLSQQPFVIPVKVLDFNEIASPHSAEIKQAETDLLGPILNEVVKIDDMERVLLSKLKMVLKEQAIDENDAKKIKDKKNVLTTGLYKKLTGEEKEFIDNEHGIARRRADNVAFGITFQYLDMLLDKIKHITD